MTLALCLLLALAGDEKRPADVVCPLDGRKFAAFEITATNDWGGRDADGCTHAFKTTPLEFYVWVCPSCGFAGTKKEFEAGLADEEKPALKAGLVPMEKIARDARQDQIPGHVKYDLLAQVAAIRKAPPEIIGRAYRYASWSCRQQGATALGDFDEWDALRESYGLTRLPLNPRGAGNRTEFDLEVARKIEKDIDAKKPSGVNRILSRYLAACLYRKHGENGEAERWLAEVAKMKGEYSNVDDAAARMAASIPLERAFQMKARGAYQTAYDAGRLDQKLAPEVAFLIGELARRTGDFKAASEWLQKALDTAESAPLKDLISKQRARLP